MLFLMIVVLQLLQLLLHYKYFKEHKNFLKRLTIYIQISLNSTDSIILVEMIGIEPMTFRLQSGRSTN